MAIENQYYDLLHAYTLGCLDSKDLTILNEFLDSGGEFFWMELGEYQNLAALLPSILNIENPGPEIKDKVARKLYRIRGEKRDRSTIETEPPKIKPEVKEPQYPAEERLSKVFTRTRTLIQEREPEKKEETPEADEKELKPELPVEDFELVTTRERLPEEDIEVKLSGSDETAEIDTGGISEEKPEVPIYQKKKNYELHGVDMEKKEKKSGAWAWIVFIILLLAAGGGFYYFYTKINTDVNSYKGVVENMNRQIKELSTQIANNREIQTVLQSKNVKLINLTGTQLSKDGYGKLIISMETSRGYLQLDNMPALPDGDYFQLWIMMNKKFSSLGIYKPTDRKDYYPFMLPELSSKGKIIFLVTVEHSNNAAEPSKEIYLTGSME